MKNNLFILAATIAISTNTYAFNILKDLTKELKNIENILKKETSDTLTEKKQENNINSEKQNNADVIKNQEDMQQIPLTTENTNTTSTPDYEFIEDSDMPYISTQSCVSKINLSGGSLLSKAEQNDLYSCAKIGYDKFLYHLNISEIKKIGVAYANANKQNWNIKEEIDNITEKKKISASLSVKSDKGFDLKFIISCSQGNDDIRFFYDTNQIFVGTRFFSGGGQASDGRAVVDKTPKEILYKLEKQTKGEFTASLSQFGILQTVGSEEKVIAFNESRIINNGNDTEFIYSFPYRIGFEFNTMRGKSFVNVPLYDSVVNKVVSSCSFQPDLSWSRPIKFSTNKNNLINK